MTPLTLVIPSESLPETSGVVRPWRMAAPTMAPTHWDTTYRAPLDTFENEDQMSENVEKNRIRKKISTRAYGRTF